MTFSLRRSGIAALMACVLASCETMKDIVAGRSCPRIISDYASSIGVGGIPRDAPHGGIDIQAPAGTPVIASADGDVVIAGFETCGGNRVLVHHGRDANGIHMWSAYGHLDSLGVRTGERVRRGQPLGTLGRTGGCSEGVNHLHFGTYVGTSNDYRFVDDPYYGWIVLWTPERTIVNPRDYWQTAWGSPAFDPKKSYPAHPIRMTYPLPCG